MVALAAFTFSYLIDPNFRNGINQLFTYLIKGCIDGVSYLTNIISEIVRSASKGRKYSGNELYHIVAQSDRRAIGSRNILSRYKIGINSSYNTVLIKKSLHKHIHTNSYHTAVYLILKSAEVKSGSWNTEKYRVISSLVFMNMLLRSANRLV